MPELRVTDHREQAEEDRRVWRSRTPEQRLDRWHAEGVQFVFRMPAMRNFRYRPRACDRDYRIVVVWKDLEIHKGQRKLFDDTRCFFYITNDFSECRYSCRLV